MEGNKQDNQAMPNTRFMRPWEASPTKQQTATSDVNNGGDDSSSDEYIDIMDTGYHSDIPDMSNSAHFNNATSSEHSITSPTKQEGSLFEQSGNQTTNDSGYNDSRSDIKPTTRLLPPKAVKVLNEWYEANVKYPYPDTGTLCWLAKEGGVTKSQVQKFLSNKRNRSQNTLSHNRVLHPKTWRARLEKNKENISRANERLTPYARRTVPSAAAGSEAQLHSNDTHNLSQNWLSSSPQLLPPSIPSSPILPPTIPPPSQIVPAAIPPPSPILPSSPMAFYPYGSPASGLSGTYGHHSSVGSESQLSSNGTHSFSQNWLPSSPPLFPPTLLPPTPILPPSAVTFYPSGFPVFGQVGTYGHYGSAMGTHGQSALGLSASPSVLPTYPPQHQQYSTSSPINSQKPAESQPGKDG